MSAVELPDDHPVVVTLRRTKEALREQRAQNRRLRGEIRHLEDRIAEAARWKAGRDTIARRLASAERQRDAALAQVAGLRARNDKLIADNLELNARATALKNRLARPLH